MRGVHLTRSAIDCDIGMVDCKLALSFLYSLVAYATHTGDCFASSSSDIASTSYTTGLVHIWCKHIVAASISRHLWEHKILIVLLQGGWHDVCHYCILSAWVATHNSCLWTTLFEVLKRLDVQRHLRVVLCGVNLIVVEHHVLMVSVTLVRTLTRTTVFLRRIVTWLALNSSVLAHRRVWHILFTLYHSRDCLRNTLSCCLFSHFDNAWAFVLRLWTEEDRLLRNGVTLANSTIGASGFTQAIRLRMLNQHVLVLFLKHCLWVSDALPYSKTWIVLMCYFMH